MTDNIRENLASYIPGLLGRSVLFLVFLWMIVTGRFDSLDTLGVLHFILLALLLSILVFEIVAIIESADDIRPRLFVICLWVIVGLRIGVQLTGGQGSYLYPAVYLVFAVLSIMTGAGLGALLWVEFGLFEIGWTIVQGGDWTSAAFHLGYMALFGAAAGLFIGLERSQRDRAEQALSRLKMDAAEFERDDTVYRMEGLSEGGRKKKSYRSTFALDKAFSAALESGRETLSADSLVLYWRSKNDGMFRLRGAADLKDSVKTDAEFEDGSGLLGWVAANGSPIKASGERASSIPHRSKGPLHMAAFPVKRGDDTSGILVAEKFEGKDFSDDDERVLESFSHLVREIHSNALVMQRAESEASQFRSLAELSRSLSRTLDLDGILEAVIRTSSAITGHDAAAVAISSGLGDDSRPSVMRVGGELGERAEGFEVEEGSLAARAIEQASMVSVRDLLERDRKTPVLGKKVDPSGMGSVLVQPLPFKKEAKGALVFFGREKNAFSEYVIRATGILADLAAASIQNAFLFGEMERKAVTDGLTGLHNHRWFQDKLSQEIERAGRIGNRVSIVLLDIDHFKKVNDTYGHPVGDEVLKGVAKTLKSSIRQVDSSARYGGEEFVLVLVGADLKGARDFSERLRKKISRLVFRGDGTEFSVTLSMGIAVYPDDAENKPDLIEAADQALYRAKESGRNRVVCFSQLGSA